MPDIDPNSELLELAHPYALDALSEHDRASVERLLDTTTPDLAAAFRSEVYRLHETLALMTVVDTVPAPATLEATLRRALDARGAKPVEEGLSPDREMASVRSIRSRRLRDPRWLAAAAAAVIVVAGAAAGVAGYSTRSHDTGGVTAQQVIDHSDAREQTVPVEGGGTITVNASRELDAAVVSFATVAAPPTGRTYQLWLISGAGQVRSAGILDALPTAQAPKLVRYGDAGTLAMSIEPEGGSPQPTTQPIVGVPLT
ncbi:anti-sigma factor [Nocardia sp. NPDC052254]|uniref:anti-sigma factor n=1 Tax=Nocardia sp. NPDC052254 TaxID=3155681 RepID=UPI003431153C